MRALMRGDAPITVWDPLFPALRGRARAHAVHMYGAPSRACRPGGELRPRPDLRASQAPLSLYCPLAGPSQETTEDKNQGVIRTAYSTSSSYNPLIKTERREILLRSFNLNN